MIRTTALALIMALVALHPAVARADEDTQGWASANATIDLDSNNFIWLEGQARLTDDAGRLGQILLRPAIGHRFDASASAMIGYVYFENRPLGRTSRYEHRLFEQFSARLVGGPGRLTVISRTRLEQRFVTGFDDIGLRLRQQVRAQVPVSRQVSAVVWTEPFISFNRTDWGQRPSVDQWRNFVGVAVPLNGQIVLEPGVMHHYINPTGAPKRYVVVGSLTLSGRF